MPGSANGGIPGSAPLVGDVSAYSRGLAALPDGSAGVVTNVQLDSDEITLRVDETNSTKIKVLPSAIQRVVTDDAGGKDSKESK